MKKIILMKYFVVLLGIAALLVFSACDTALPESTASSAPASQESSLSSHAESMEESSEAHSLVSEDMPEESSEAEESSAGSIVVDDPVSSFPELPSYWVSPDEEIPEELIKGAEEVAQEWVDDLLDNEGDSEVLECFYQNIDIYQISEDQNTICFSLEIVFKPKNYNEPFWWAGNTQEGTGDLKGYLLWGRQVKAAKEADGWTKISGGTGGVGLE